MSDTTESGSNDTFKIGISRRQLRNNLHVIEDGLRRMQEEIEKKQRDNSIGYGENLEELLEELKRDQEKSELPADTIIFIFHKVKPNLHKMRSQKVGVDVWKMVFSSCSYLGLACAAWILIKLVCACFWLPNYLQTEEKKEKEAEENAEKKGEEGETEALIPDKKND